MDDFKYKVCDILEAAKYLESHCRDEQVSILISELKDSLVLRSYNGEKELVEITIPQSRLQTYPKITITKRLGDFLEKKV